MQVNIEGNQATTAELILREEFRELDEVVIHDFIPDLLIVLHVDSTILEHTILHLDIVEQTVLWVESVEERILIYDWLPLPWNIPVVLFARTDLSQSNDTLARFYQIHACWSISCSRQEFSIVELDRFHA